jgi:hypothetical protein
VLSLMRFVALTCVALLVVMLFPASPAAAFKPYTHNYTGDRAWEDVNPDGRVTINGREYTVRAAVWQALRNNRASYNAGVVGPDGFPELVFGQSIIHPEMTGRWLRHIFTKAWQAQTSSTYSAAEKEQILAFAYGYLTHASGDMWAHTLVNDFAMGVFPAVSEILTDVDKAEIALRHIIVEGYIGDATPGYDGNPNRTTLPDGDVSDDSTPGTSFSAPMRFIYETLVNPRNPLPVGTCNNGQNDDLVPIGSGPDDAVADDGCPGQSYTQGAVPEPQRGKLIDFFLDMEADLQIKEARIQDDRTHSDCTTLDPDCYDDSAVITVGTVRGLRQITVPRTRCDAEFFCFDSATDALDDLIVNPIIEEYLEHWIEDIEDGLADWGELGMALTKALFDAQTYRDAQNEICRNKGNETNPLRIDCEDHVGALDVVTYAVDPFINDHLLSMMGAPDFIGDLRDFFGDAFDVIEDIIAEILPPELNFVALAREEIKEAIIELIKDEIESAYGMDVDQLTSFLKHPTHWLNVQQINLTLPGLGSRQLDLFQAGDHARLDSFMELAADHHVPATLDIPGFGSVVSTRPTDSAVFNLGGFDIYLNTVTLNKLLLLDGAELNRALGDLLAASGVIHNASLVRTYVDGATVPANVMIDQLSGNEPWLQSIDADHGWRADGKPRFTGPRPAGVRHGGNGLFPLWESCLLRPTFRSLFRDWENDNNPGEPNFPDLDDLTSSDPSDTAPPVAGPLVVGGTTFVSGGVTYVAGNNSLGLSAHDVVFTDAHVGVQRRVYPASVTPGASDWLTHTNGGTFSIVGADGLWKVDYRSGDPCHALAAQPVARTESFVLDATAPTIDITSPAPEGVVFDSDDLSSIQWTASDGALGSGVASESATLDGASAARGLALDMFLLGPGDHAVVVTAADNLGNTRVVTRNFEIHATAASLLTNLTRLFNEGKIARPGIYNSLSAKVAAALRAHERGQHSVEANILGAFINELEAQSGKAVDATMADLLISFAEDLIATGN